MGIKNEKLKIKNWGCGVGYDPHFIYYTHYTHYSDYSNYIHYSHYTPVMV